MSARYEAARIGTRDGRESFGVIDHHGFVWVKKKNGEIMEVASLEGAQAWVDQQSADARADR